MKEVTLKIHDRDYGIISKVAMVREKSVEDVAFESLKSFTETYMQECLGEIMGLGEHGNYDHVFEKEEASNV